MFCLVSCVGNTHFFKNYIFSSLVNSYDYWISSLNVFLGCSKVTVYLDLRLDKTKNGFHSHWNQNWDCEETMYGCSVQWRIGMRILQETLGRVVLKFDVFRIHSGCPTQQHFAWYNLVLFQDCILCSLSYCYSQLQMWLLTKFLHLSFIMYLWFTIQFSSLKCLAAAYITRFSCLARFCFSALIYLLVSYINKDGSCRCFAYCLPNPWGGADLPPA